MADLAAIKRLVGELKAKGEINKAIGELEKAIKEFPKEGSLFNELGDLYMKINRQEDALDVYEKGVYILKEETYYPNAIGLCKKILRLDKERTEIYGVLGELYREYGQLGEAANALLEYAERKMKANDIETALKTYEAIKDLVPNNYKIIQTISAIFEKFGKKAASAEIRKEAEIIKEEQRVEMSITPSVSVQEPPVVVEEPVIVEETKKPEIVKEEKEIQRPSAVEGALKEEITIDDIVSPEVARLLKSEVVVEEKTEIEEIEEKITKEVSEFEKTKNLGEIYLSLGEEEEAINCFREAAALAYKEKRYEQAIELNNKIAELRPFDLKSRQYLVEISRTIGHKKLQIEAMNELALALIRRDAKTEAQSLFRKVLELDSNNNLALKMIEEISKPKEFIDLSAILKTELEGGEKSEELQTIDKLISQFKKEVFEAIGEGDYRSHYDLGVAYKGMGLHQEAIEEFEIASKDENLKLKCYEMIGSCLIDKGNLDEAIKVLNEGLNISNRPPSEYFGIHFLLGNIYEMKKNIPMAIKSYVNAAQIDKTVPDLAKKIAELKEHLTEELKKRERSEPSKKPEEEKASVTPEKIAPKKSKVTYL